MQIKLFFIVFLATFSVVAQDTIRSVAEDDTMIVPLEFNQEELARFKKDRELTYEVVPSEPSIFEKAWDWFVRGLNKVLSWLFGNGPAGTILRITLKVLPYVLLGVLLFLILRFFLKVNTGDLAKARASENPIHISTAEAVLHMRDLSELREAAIADKKYRLAVRYYYLSVLQRLSDKDYIDWHQDKTNEDYLAELSEKSLKEAFERSTYLYDFVWYGNFEIDKEHFEKARQDFESLLKRIG
ncbi:DUF4129 domain-containing protein [Flavobacteriaceae bacterium F08102]|nr:DUF4129 domain-containing protein [Flavobacteriaceae bacterium F08102]